MQPITIQYFPELNAAILKFYYDDSLTQLAKDIGAEAVYEESNNSQAADLWRLGFNMNQAQVKKKFKYWKLELNAESAGTLEKIKDDSRFKIDPLIFDAISVKMAWQKENLRMSAAIKLQDERLEINMPFDNKLKEYQRVAIEYMHRNAKGVILADDIELDRKSSLIATVELGGFYPLLIVTHNFIGSEIWGYVLNEFCPDKEFKMVEGYKWEDDNTPASIYIVKYNLLHQYKNILGLINWDCIILDETKLLNNPKTLTSITTREIIKDIKHRFLISDTNLKESPHELAFQLETLGLIKEFGGFWKFINKYTNSYQAQGKGWVFRGAKNTAALDRELREVGYIRRTKEQIQESK